MTKNITKKLILAKNIRLVTFWIHLDDLLHVELKYDLDDLLSLPFKERPVNRPSKRLLSMKILISYWLII